MSRYYEDELIHYGVKGMKWGVRRYQPYSYTGGGSGKEIGLAKKLSKAGGPERWTERRARKKANKAIIKQRKEDVKNRRTMTDEELNERINRIRRENELQNLTRQNIETPASRELKNIGNKYKNRVEEDVVNATYNAAKVAAKKGVVDKVIPKVISNNPFRKRYVEISRIGNDGSLIPEKRKPYGPHTELNPNTSKPAKRMRDKILERSKVDGLRDMSKKYERYKDKATKNEKKYNEHLKLAREKAKEADKTKKKDDKEELIKEANKEFRKAVGYAAISAYYSVKADDYKKKKRR